MLTAEAMGLLKDMGPEELQGVESIVLQDRSSQGDRELRDLGVDLRPEQQEEQEQQWAGDLHRESSRSGITEHQGGAGLMNLLGLDLRQEEEQPPQELQIQQPLGNFGGSSSPEEVGTGFEETGPSIPEQRQGFQFLQHPDNFDRTLQEAVTGTTNEAVPSVPNQRTFATVPGKRQQESDPGDRNRNN